MTIKKKIKTNKISKLPVEKVKVVDHYYDLFFFRQQPVSEAYIDRLSKEMIDFAELDTTLRPSQFWNARKLNNAYIYRWKEKWPQLQQAYTYLMAMCAERRELGAITRKFDGNYIDRTQAMYDPEYKEFLAWKAAISDKNRDAQGTLIVQMMPAPSSSLVPERKKLDEQV